MKFLPRVPEVRNRTLRRIYSYTVISVYVTLTGPGNVMVAISTAAELTRSDYRDVMDLHREAMAK